MDNFHFKALGPLDGRYHEQTKILAPYFSESALFKYRVKVEIEYLIALIQQLNIPLKMETHAAYDLLRSIYVDFDEADVEWIKQKEKITNHDVKAVEYFIKNKLKETPLAQEVEWVHFGLTSQDINNTALPLMLRDAMKEVINPAMLEIVARLSAMAKQWWHIPMLAHTHGQPASPTRLGKEIYVFIERLENQLKQQVQIPFAAKFGGATGNFNAHNIAFPNQDWEHFSDQFINNFNMTRLKYTTQIEHYDSMCALFDNLKRINNILIDLARDMWAYISMEYFGQNIKEGEIGSSAMPHKVNPIDFENAEGNLGIANALYEHFSAKLPISRLQRDLSDSTVTRNIGVPLGHTLLAYKSLLKGLDKLKINEEVISMDLEYNWAVVAEAYQTVLRREGIPNAYELLKGLTRTGNKIDAISLQNFIKELPIAQEIKNELSKITPHNYIGNIKCPID